MKICKTLVQSLRLDSPRLAASGRCDKLGYEQAHPPEPQGLYPALPSGLSGEVSPGGGLRRGGCGPSGCLYVDFPLPLAAAIGLSVGESVQWGVLDRGELHLSASALASAFGQRKATQTNRKAGRVTSAEPGAYSHRIRVFARGSILGYLGRR